MMKAKGAWFWTLVLALAIYGVGLAAETNTTKSPAPAASETKDAQKKAKKTKTTPKRFRGEITAVDAKAGTLSVKSEGGEKNFVAQEAAKESLERVRLGDRVKISYSEKEGKLFASSVRRLKVKNADTTKSQKDAMKAEKESTAAPKAKDSAKTTK